MRLLIIRPCCIGDVIMATAALRALRDAYPDAHLTFAVGGWSRQAIDYHPAVDAILDTGAAAMPVKSVGGLWRFVRQIRAGHFDVAISLVRSPLMSLALLLSGIPVRAGINSNGRGFGYTHGYPLDPADPLHEAQIYLNVVAQLGIETTDYPVNLPILPDAQQHVRERLAASDVDKPYIVLNPAGGSNPGMVLDSKRWPPQQVAAVGDALAERYNAQVILLGGPQDSTLLEAVAARLSVKVVQWAGVLSFAEIGALAAGALLYLGNDTGLTHLAAASGAKTAIVMGISDPRRYRPFTDDHLLLWKATTMTEGGVSQADNTTWDWERDGITAAEALPLLFDFIDDSA